MGITLIQKENKGAYVIVKVVKKPILEQSIEKQKHDRSQISLSLDQIDNNGS